MGTARQLLDKADSRIAGVLQQIGATYPNVRWAGSKTWDFVEFDFGQAVRFSGKLDLSSITKLAPTQYVATQVLYKLHAPVFPDAGLEENVYRWAAALIELRMNFKIGLAPEFYQEDDFQYGKAITIFPSDSIPRVVPPWAHTSETNPRKRPFHIALATARKMHDDGVPGIPKSALNLCNSLRHEWEVPGLDGTLYYTINGFRNGRHSRYVRDAERERLMEKHYGLGPLDELFERPR